jgi:hypothetical protein
LQCIATSCAQYEPSSILDQEIQILRETLIKRKIKPGSSPKGNSTYSSSLGVKTSTLKENPKLTKEERQRVKRNNQQFLQGMGEIQINYK